VLANLSIGDDTAECSALVWDGTILTVDRSLYRECEPVPTIL